MYSQLLPLAKQHLLRSNRIVSLTPYQSVLVVSLSIAGALLGLRAIGGLQLLEIAAFDQFVRLQSDRPPGSAVHHRTFDPRLLVVGISEADIKAEKQWPISDRTLSQLLIQLQKHRPRVIGIDLYRDVPQPPGSAELLQQMQAPNVVAIAKLSDSTTEGIPAVPGIPEERIGFNDVIIDADGVVRRNFIYAYIGEQKFYSFALRLSLQYLKDRSISLQVQPRSLQLEKAIFPRLQPNSGGYHNLDDAGYQVLLSYRSDRVARQVTLAEVLAGKVDPTWIEDKIILIGSTAPSIRDLFLTPYSSGRETDFNTPGVHLHAHFISQILGAVLEEKPLFWFWSEWQEGLWIWIWAFVGGAIAWRFQRPLALGLAGVVALASLYGICFGAFLQVGWIPFVPPALALVLTAGCAIAYKLLYNTLHDALTGLPNRGLFLQQLESAIAKRRSQATSFAVLFLDLDGFKVINEGLGHHLGDRLLIRVGHRLKAGLPPHSTLARVGGDEFAVLLEQIDNLQQATAVVDRVQQDLALPFSLGQQEVFTSVSVGIALSQPEMDYQPEDLLRDAHTAMYRAKDLGKARHEVFATGMHVQILERLQLETELRRAIAGLASLNETQPEFQLYYQAIVSLETGKVTGFEALIRWKHPQNGFISPAQFIPLAEEIGAIVPLGKWIFQAACRQLRLWETQFSDSPPVLSVNLSGQQLVQPDLVAFIERTLTENQLDGRNLKLEITESVAMGDVSTTIDLLLQLRALNLRLSIDDFGTGYSSLSYLHRFPVNTLKVDRSFVTRMSDTSEDEAIVQTIVMLSHRLGMDIVAEGVETIEQALALRSLQCEYGQGYFFSKPVDSEAATALLSKSFEF